MIFLKADKRFVYILIRRGKRAEPLVVRPMYNARAVEKALHRMFDDSRFDMSKRIWPHRYLQHHIKIGIAKNMSKRLSTINKNINKSGYTEWFAMNDLELVTLRFWLMWYQHRLRVYLALLAALLIFFGYLYCIQHPIIAQL